ncbi:MAG TPA: methyltransferase domain-containing protein [Polyangia bacterium]|nr:methyltransferase domain-containing protein [Polyangia bacterium]
MLPDILTPLLVCPRCRGTLTPAPAAEELRCAACGVAFPVRSGVPRMSDGAESRDEAMQAEWTAQQNAHALYMDPSFIMNDWERAVLPRLDEWLGDAPGATLDVGCGVGKLGEALTARGRGRTSLVGTDFQSTLLAEARVGYAALVQADVHHLPFKDGAFAAAITTNALHHFPDPVRAMSEIARILRPGGVLVTFDPRYVTPLEKLKKILRKNDDMFTKDHKAFRVDEYRDLLGSSGLRVTDVRAVDPLGPLLSTALDYLKVGRLGVAAPIARALAGLDRAIGPTPIGLMVEARAVKPGAPA